ncbi:MAG: DUF2298 domain-containing protein [Anaerolineae bacterium]
MAFRHRKTTSWLLTLLFLVVLLLAGWLRTYNLDWDKGTHLHPDERYLTMVASALEPPETWADYWDPAASTMNPENQGYAGYVYGTFPLFLTRVVGGWLDALCTVAPPATLLSCSPGLYTGYNGIHLVGRALSTLADLLTLVVLTALAYQLFDAYVALLAAALYACAVLPIQHSHFFVVDNFATLFVITTLTFSVHAVLTGRRWPLFLGGVATGLAVASKISTWPTALIVAAGGVLQRRRTEKGDTYTLTLNVPSLLTLVGSGVLAALVFRTAQPYAFSGPGFLNVGLNESWLENMRYIRRLVSGEIDVPYGHQWANRTPLLFPWRNMVIWGLGLPLGLTAWLGWGVFARHTLRHRRWVLLLPWFWATGFFLYQGVQWVKSMRYLLPVYPLFVLFAAWVVVWGRRKLLDLAPRLRILRHLVSTLGRAGPWLLLGGAALWAAAFMQIYVQPFTRVAASRWIYDHVPTAATLHTTSGQQYQLPITPNTRLGTEGGPLTVPLTVDRHGTVGHLTLNKVNHEGRSSQRTIHVTVSRYPGNREVLTKGTAQVTLDGVTPAQIEIPLSPASLKAGEQLYVNIHLQEGPPLTLDTSVLGNEHWDDSLPIRLEGKDAFHNWYRGLSSTADGKLHLYDEDTPQKHAQLLDWLDEVDYIVLSSNRLYASIPRLPQRYPMTIRFYETLFNGELGFELAAEFVSYPALGPCQFPDQETPFEPPSARYSNARPCSIQFPPAEEAFSVYDHPQVFIFAKTPAYSRERATQLISPSLTEQARWMTPLQATRGIINSENDDADEDPGPRLLMDARMRAVQYTGGTWSHLFYRDAPQNRFQSVTVLLWWLMLALLGLMAVPWLQLAFPDLRLHGYGFGRSVGLLLWAYPAWLLAALHLTVHTRTLLWGILTLWLGATALLTRARWSALKTFFRTRWRDLLRIEILFTVLFLGWVLVRYLNPDLFHPVAGGEKPMDFAYLNAVIKSRYFPPYDPWFAGGTMNYYYFGFVLIGTLVEALGIIPSIAYNLAIPTLFALTGVGGYTLASNLVVGDDRRARRAGLWGLLLTVVLGNLGELRLIVKGLAEVGNVHFESLLPGYRLLVSAAAGFWKVMVRGVELSFRPEWWYWNATRVVEVKPAEPVPPINEFPAFTFLYGDLHAHAMALPLTQVALGIAVQWAVRKVSDIGEKLLFNPWTLALAALVAGALRATNTWDYPTYLLLMGVGYLLPLLPTLLPDDKGTMTMSRSPWRYVPLGMPVVIFLLAELLFRPYAARYVTAYTSVEPWQGGRTPLSDYLVMHGQFILPLALFAVGQVLLRLRETCHNGTVWVSLGIVVVGMLLLLSIFHAIDVQAAWIAVPLGTLAAILLLSDTRPQRQTLWLWVGTALALTLMVEVIVLKGDIGRMNTVFKFYLQVWILLATASAVALEALFNMLLWGGADAGVTARDPLHRALVENRHGLGDVVIGVLLVVVLATALYPLFAIPAKLRDRWSEEAPHTLDGAAFIPYVTQYENGGRVPLAPDAEVIRWLQDNVEGSPVIMEAQAAREYLWGNRMSVYTGLPSVVGWRWHQAQQRMVMPAGTVEMRQQDVRDFYNTPNPDHAWLILDKYNVAYVVLTPYEQLYMPAVREQGETAPALTKFDKLTAQGRLEVVFDTGEARVFRVRN